MKIRFNANDNLPFKKPLKLHLLTIIFRYISEEDGNFYPQLYLDDCLYELSMLQYDRIVFQKELMLIKRAHQKNVILSVLFF